MEAYFHNDPRIEEWIDQITEKIFTVCLLSGVDSDAEFQRGSQIVAKVTSLLLGISMFPSEYLEDGLRQLLEQQLPDKRVIENFPSFQDTMDKMLREGMSKAALGTQSKEVVNSTVFLARENAKEGIEKLPEENTSRPLEMFNEENVMESVIPALAIVNDIQEDAFEINTDTDTKSKEEGPELIDHAIITRDSSLQSKLQISNQENCLRHVLKRIFPNASVCWDYKLNDQTFIAQVEDILIWQHDPMHPCLVEDNNKKGWKVFVCDAEDLSFPRRLERGIRQLMRSGKSSTIV